MTSDWVEHAATGIEILGAAILVTGISCTLIRAVMGVPQFGGRDALIFSLVEPSAPRRPANGWLLTTVDSLRTIVG